MIPSFEVQIYDYRPMETSLNNENHLSVYFSWKHDYMYMPTVTILNGGKFCYKMF